MNTQFSEHQTQIFPFSNSKSPLYKLQQDYNQVKTATKRLNRGGSPSSSIVIEDGKVQIRIAVENILFAKAEHVYVGIYFSNDQRIFQRGSLAGLLNQLPADQFIQVHRSYVVNLRWVESWTKDTISIGGKEIPISRARRNDVIERLKSRG